MSRRKKTDVSVAARIDTSSTPRRFIVEHAVSVKKDSSKYGSLLEAYNHDDHQLKVSVSPLPPKQDHFAELDKAVRKTRKIWRRKKKKELLQAEIEAELLQANHVVVEEVKKGEEEKEVEITVSSIVRELIRKESSKNVSRRVSSQRHVEAALEGAMCSVLSRKDKQGSISACMFVREIIHTSMISAKQAAQEKEKEGGRGNEEDEDNFNANVNTDVNTVLEKDIPQLTEEEGDLLLAQADAYLATYDKYRPPAAADDAINKHKNMRKNKKLKKAIKLKFLSVANDGSDSVLGSEFNSNLALSGALDLKKGYSEYQLPPFGGLEANIDRYKKSSSESGLFLRGFKSPTSTSNGTGTGKRTGKTSWPSQSLEFSALSWVEKQRNFLSTGPSTSRISDKERKVLKKIYKEEENNNNNMSTFGDSLFDPPGVNGHGVESNNGKNVDVDIYQSLFQKHLSRMDLLFCISHCSCCKSHMTLRHDENQYMKNAIDCIRDLLDYCTEWRPAARIGVIRIPRTAQDNVDVDFTGTGTGNGNGNGNSSGYNRSLLESMSIFQQNIKVGAFEIQVMFLSERGDFVTQNLHSKLLSKKWPGGLLIPRLKVFLNLELSQLLPFEVGVPVLGDVEIKRVKEGKGGKEDKGIAVVAGEEEEEEEEDPFSRVMSKFLQKGKSFTRVAEKVMLEHRVEERRQKERSFPLCAYPLTCSRGCRASLAQIAQSKHDRKTCDTSTSVDSKKEGEGVIPQSNEETAERMRVCVENLQGKHTKELDTTGIHWTVDFSFESAIHAFFCGDVVDVCQIAPLNLSPRRKKKRGKRGKYQKRFHGNGNETGGNNNNNKHYSLLKADTVACGGILDTDTKNDFDFSESKFYPHTHTHGIPLDATADTSALGGGGGFASTATAGTGAGTSVSSPQRLRSPTHHASTATISTTTSTSGVSTSVYSPQRLRRQVLEERTAATSTNLFLDTILPFNTRQNTPATATSATATDTHHTHQQKQKNNQKNRWYDRNGLDQNRKFWAEKGPEHDLWYSQGFLRGLVTSAHRDGTYDVAYLPHQVGAIQDQNMYVMNSYPAYATLTDRARAGFVHTGVEEKFMTTCRVQNTNDFYKNDQSDQNDHHIRTGGGVTIEKEKEDEKARTPYVLVFSHEDLAKERRPWIRSSSSQSDGAGGVDVTALLERLFHEEVEEHATNDTLLQRGDIEEGKAVEDVAYVSFF